jgi:TatD DNase family protein
MSKRNEPDISEILIPGMIDSHFHSAMMKLKGLDPLRHLKEACVAGFSGGIDIGVEAGDTAERAWVHEEFPELRLAAGIAPAAAEKIHSGATTLETLITTLEADLDSFPVEALGEIGVDAHWNYGSPELQAELFEAQIETANRRGLPIIVHNRGADSLLLEVFGRRPPEHGGIMHCYSSGYETAKSCMEYGLFISFAGNLTYRKSDALREAARRIPPELLLAETDSPYLSPEPLRGKANHPARVAYVYRVLASLRDVPVEVLVEEVGENFRRLFL